MDQQLSISELQISDSTEAPSNVAQASVGQQSAGNWLSTLQNRIENGVRGFDATAVVEDCATAAKRGKSLSRGLIFGSLKAAGVGPLLLCDKLP